MAGPERGPSPPWVFPLRASADRATIQSIYPGTTMSDIRTTTDADLPQRLIQAGLRPTPQRLAIGRLVLCGPHRHFSAEQIWQEAKAAGQGVSLATVYNTLNGFAASHLLRQVDLPTAAGVFDNNTTPHHHLIDTTSGAILDLPAQAVQIHLDAAALPEGARLEGLDLVVRVRSR